MNRIVFIGASGAGKTWLARKIAARTKLKLFSLDDYCFRNGQRFKPIGHEWDAILESVLKNGSWIVEGNYSDSLQRWLINCDTVVLLDTHRLTCLWRILFRMVRSHKHSPPRPRIPNVGLISWVWRYETLSRPAILKLLEQHREDKQIFLFRSKREISEFIGRI